MRKHHDEVVIGQVRADEILLQVTASADRQGRLSLRVHDVHRGDGREAVRLGRLQVVGRAGPTSAVGRVAFDDGAVQLAHQVGDQVRPEEVVTARLPR